MPKPAITTAMGQLNEARVRKVTSAGANHGLASANRPMAKSTGRLAPPAKPTARITVENSAVPTSRLIAHASVRETLILSHARVACPNAMQDSSVKAAPINI